MPILSVLIPTHRRPECCLSLIKSTLAEIKKAHLENQVEICVSENDPIESIQFKLDKLLENYESISVMFLTTGENIGYANNFHKVVTMARGEFCILVGDDDHFAHNELSNLVKTIETHPADLFISSFVSCGENGSEDVLYPTRSLTQDQRMVLSNKIDFENWFGGIHNMNGNNSGLFIFISNVVFRRENWHQFYNEKDWNHSSIYFQAYIHMKTALSGKTIQYLHAPLVIRNAKEDFKIRQNPAYCANIIIDLTELIDYFFTGDLLKCLKEELVPYGIYGYAIEKLESYTLREKLKAIDDPILRRFEKLYLKKDQWSSLQKKTIVIFGCGKVGNDVTLALKKISVKISFYTDNNSAVWGSLHRNIPIISPKEATLVPGAIFILAISCTLALTNIADELIAFGVLMDHMYIILP